MVRRIARAAGSAAAALALFAHAQGAPPAASSRASAEGALDGGEPRVTAQLLVHPDDGSAGELRIGVLLEMDPGWHVYWRNPGGSGLATEVRFLLDRAQVGPLRWPAPARFFEPEAGVTTYGYEGRVLLSARARLEAEGDSPPRLLRAEVDLLACHDRCIPARFELERALASPSAAPDSAAVRTLFAESEARVPAAAPTLDAELRAWRETGGDGRLLATLAVLGAADGARAEFFPEPAPALAVEADAQSRALERLAGIGLEIRGSAPPPAGSPRLEGVLALHVPGAASRFADVSVPLESAPPAAAAPPEAAARAAPASRAAPAPRAVSTGGLRALGLALVGGLLLNLMPCVLPVLAIKVFSLVQLGHAGRSEALRHALAYALGIQLSLLALAAVVVGLRIAGAQVGWGFQFQEPVFLLALCLLVVTFGLNLLGVFEIDAQSGRLAQLGSEASGVRRSCFDGFLAVALATPCTAPFLGTAVGFALVGSPWNVPLVFAAIGAGLALPFLLVACWPGAARWLPRPGAWMLTLRELLGFTLLATAVWLLFVLGRAQGVHALVLALALLWVTALGCWSYGRAQRAGRTRLARSSAVLALLVLALGAFALRAQRETPDATREASAWRPYDRAAIERELARGRRVFVDFTADWCLTCTANERLVLAHPRVRDAFERRQVALFKADWTRRDEAIGAELARFGRAGVPLYLLYHPDDREAPIVLPELLTPDLVVGALERTGATAAPAVTSATSPASILPIE